MEMVSDKRIHKALRIHKTLWPKPIRENVYFTIYHNYTLALIIPVLGSISFLITFQWQPCNQEIDHYHNLVGCCHGDNPLVRNLPLWKVIKMWLSQTVTSIGQCVLLSNISNQKIFFFSVDWKKVRLQHSTELPIPSRFITSACFTSLTARLYVILWESKRTVHKA